MPTNMPWLDEINWDQQGLVPAIAQDKHTGKILMLAWMNREALEKSAVSGIAVYWSRSRQKLWQKGETSGHIQKITEIRVDCDKDAILLIVEQTGGIACHTGRHNCFFMKLENDQLISVDPVLKDPVQIYSTNSKHPDD
jgi:phosphoribosyl-AMP cyclohydrolase